MDSTADLGTQPAMPSSSSSEDVSHSATSDLRVLETSSSGTTLAPKTDSKSESTERKYGRFLLSATKYAEEHFSAIVDLFSEKGDAYASEDAPEIINDKRFYITTDRYMWINGPAYYAELLKSSTHIVVFAYSSTCGLIRGAS